MKNKLSDLNNHLFEQLERLMDDEVCCDAEATEKEIKKSDAVVKIAKTIIDNGSLQLSALRTSAEWNYQNKDLPEMLRIGVNK